MCVTHMMHSNSPRIRIDPNFVYSPMYTKFVMQTSLHCALASYDHKKYNEYHVIALLLFTCISISHICKIVFIPLPSSIFLTVKDHFRLKKQRFSTLKSVFDGIFSTFTPHKTTFTVLERLTLFLERFIHRLKVLMLSTKSALIFFKLFLFN